MTFTVKITIQGGAIKLTFSNQDWIDCKRLIKQYIDECSFLEIIREK